MTDDLIADDEHDIISNVIKVVRVCSNQNSELNGFEKLPYVKKLLHSENICSALSSLADMRESLYGSNAWKMTRKNCKYALLSAKEIFITL